MEETELRARLQGLAHRTAPPTQDEEDLVSIVADRLRDRRRKEWALAAMAAVVVVAFVAVPTVRSWTASDADPAAPAAPTGVYSPPPRGTLAGEASFVEGVRRLSWTSGPAGQDVPEPPLDTRRVVWTGGVSAARWALVAGADPAALPPDQGVDPADLDRLGSVAIAWFTGPAGAAAEEMTLFSVPRVVDADEPTAVTGSTGSVVVVAAPGDRIETSNIAWVEPDGTLTRDWGPQDAPEGVLITDAWPVEASVDRSMRYRVTRGDLVFEGAPDAYPNPDAVPREPAVELARLRPAPPPAAGDAAVAAAIDDLLSRTGVTVQVLAFTVVWAGDVPTSDGGSARLTLLTAEFTAEEHTAGGGVYVTAALGWERDGQVGSSTCGSETRSADPPVEQSVFVVHCGRGGAPADAPMESLVVVAPPGSGTARAMDSNDRPLAEYPLTDGVAVVETPADLATVQVLDADGDPVDDRTPMETVDFDG